MTHINWRDWVAYVVWDPEVHTFSYDSAVNEDDLDRLSIALLPRKLDQTAMGQAREALLRVQSELPRLTRGRPEIKRRPMLGRYRLVSALVFAARPKFVVEIGVHHGLETLVLHESLVQVHGGGQFELLSIDVNPANGWLPRRAEIENWQFICQDAVEALSTIGRHDGPVLAILDATPDPESALLQVQQVLRITGEAEVILVGNAEWNHVVRDLDRVPGYRVESVNEASVAHWYPGRKVDVAYRPKGIAGEVISADDL